MPLPQALGRITLVLTWLVVTSVAAHAQNQQQQAVSGVVPGNVAAESHAQTVSRINGGRVGIISGGIGGTYIRIATDLASVLDDGDKVRILPIMGKGSVQNIVDILYLKGVDVGIVQSDVLSYLKKQPGFGDISNRIHYIAKLYNEEFHLVASSKIASVKDLAGKRVNFGVKGSGTFMTASTVFNALGVKVVPVHHDQALALQKIKAGQIAATVYVAGKPARAIAGLQAQDGLRLVPIPYTRALQATYLPAAFVPDDYPGLLKGSQPVETIAVGAVMAVFNWRPGNGRYNRVVKFVEAFFSRFDAFQQPPRHKKWREVNLNATLPGWTRFTPAARWLAANNAPAQAKAARNPAGFAPGRSARLSRSQQEALFREFIRWKQSQQ